MDTDGLDNIIQGLAGSFDVSENNIYGEHPHFSCYKNVGKYALSQRKRREEFLQRQAKSRESFRNRIRSNFYENLENDEAENIENDEVGNLEGSNQTKKVDSPKKGVETINKFNNFAGGDTAGFEGMDFGKWGVKSKKNSKCVKIKPKVDKKNFETETQNHEKHSFTGYLMFSEWLVDIPQISTFSTDWIMLPCPIGKRTLVVALNGATTAYNKNGLRIAQFQTEFPGGSRGDNVSCSLLDCILDKGSKRYYILDVICWNNSHFVDTEFKNRRQFLSKHFSEAPEQSENGNNIGSSYSFTLLPSCYCTNEEMTELIFRNFDFNLDGVLFYYSKVTYTPGQTPLVGWLKPWMLPEILNIDVPTKYSDQKGFYDSSQQFIEYYNKKHNFKSSIVKNIKKVENLENAENESMQS